MKNNLFNMEDHTAEFSTEDIQANTVLSGIGYIPPLFFIPLVACNNSPFAKFHANQALVLFISMIALSVCDAVVMGLFAVLGLIPIIGFLFKLIGGLLSIAIGLGSLGLFLTGMINAFMGNAKKLPIIGQFTILK